jgi:hypothetical protein
MWGLMVAEMGTADDGAWRDRSNHWTPVRIILRPVMTLPALAGSIIALPFQRGPVLQVSAFSGYNRRARDRSPAPQRPGLFWGNHPEAYEFYQRGMTSAETAVRMKLDGRANNLQQSWRFDWGTAKGGFKGY